MLGTANCIGRAMAQATGFAATAVVPERDVRAVPWYRSLRSRLLLGMALGSVAVLVAATLIVQASARELLMSQSQREIRALAEQTALGLDAKLGSVEVGAATLAEAVHGVGHDPRTFAALLHAAVKGDVDVAGAMLILEPAALAPGDPGYHWYVRRDGERFHTQSMLSPGYDYHDQPWWRRTVGRGEAWWSEPYRNAATGNEMFVTYNLPLRRDDAQPVGMVSLDVPVRRLAALVGAQTLHSPVQRLVLSPERLYVVHPSPALELRVSLDARAREVDNGALRPLLEAVRERRPANVTYSDPVTRMRRIAMVQPVPHSAWTVLVTVSERYALDELSRSTRAVIGGGLLAVLLLVLVLSLIARPITGPLLALSDSAGHFVRGDFDWPLPHTERSDEVGLLARAFDRARASIRAQLGEIERLARSRQKLESELSIARDIQLAMLHPAPVLRQGGHVLRAHALLEPAKAVGGDFYTFFARDGRQLWFAIGDVSDKGVPAALFMARTITVMEVAAGLGGTPEQALRAAASRLVEGNDTCMFATVLCGLMDVASGELQLASAGHESPVRVHADGRREFLPVQAGPPLGLEIADHYPVWRGRLQPGDALLAYTDGISEAFDTRQQAFGEDRLLDALLPDANPQQLCTALAGAVRGFVGGAEQSDDITLLALCWSIDVEGSR